jgi:AAA15 family ATPase/GTPase
MTEQTNAHFLTDIEIKEFKCFTDFKASGFKQVNLIGGKNNIGKTALLEAIYIHVSSKTVNTMITAIYNVKFDRESLNTLYHYYPVLDHKKILDFTKSYVATSNLINTEYFIFENDATKTYQINIGDKLISIDSNVLSITFEHIPNIKIIDNFGWADGGIISAYTAIQRHEQENELNAFIHEFDSSIEAFKVMNNKPQCKSNGEYRDIVEFGDGLKHYISIICALYACENGYLFIDEIDNGIYYDQLDRLWEIILTLSKQNNCQIFATTHSKEMLESFARIAKKLNEQDVSYTRLIRNKKQELKSITFDYEVLEYSLENEHEVR